MVIIAKPVEQVRSRIALVERTSSKQIILHASGRSEGRDPSLVFDGLRYDFQPPNIYLSYPCRAQNIPQWNLEEYFEIVLKRSDEEAVLRSDT